MEGIALVNNVLIFDGFFYINPKGKKFDFSLALGNYEDCF